jgi:hypothetical protein
LICRPARHHANDNKALIDYAQPILKNFRANMLRVHTLLSTGGPQGAKPNGEVVAKIQADINERKA